MVQSLSEGCAVRLLTLLKNLPEWVRSLALSRSGPCRRSLQPQRGRGDRDASDRTLRSRSVRWSTQARPRWTQFRVFRWEAADAAARCCGWCGKLVLVLLEEPPHERCCLFSETGGCERVSTGGLSAGGASSDRSSLALLLLSLVQVYHSQQTFSVSGAKPLILN